MQTPDHAKPTTNPKPRDEEIDVYGISHRGKVREKNQDHFLIATIHKRVHVVQTNIIDHERLPMEDERLAFLAMVADGVGGAESGEEASLTALEIATQYMARSTDCYYRANAEDEHFITALQDAAMRSHEAVQAQALASSHGRTMATTLTLWMGVWPWYYLLQVGDSRCYVYRSGTLSQITRDQTIAQDLIDQGVFTQAMADRSKFADVLSSALGGESALPVVTRFKADWDNVHLLCTDGLTKHVSNERIAERLAAMTTAKEVCDQLLKDALDAGGTDNISIIVGRAVRQPPAA